MIRTSFSRLSPLLLLAAALLALAVLFAPGAQPAQAQVTTHWSATLTVSAAGALVGCNNDVSGSECSSTSVLTDDDFTYDSVGYEVTKVLETSAPGLVLELNKVIPAGLKSALTLNVDSTAYPLANGSLDANNNKRIRWSISGVSWSAGDTISLSLTEPRDPTQPFTHWSDTLTVKTLDYGNGVQGYGCGYQSGQPQCSAGLTNRVITYHGATYTVELVQVAYGGGTLQFVLDREPRDRDGSTLERSRLRLHVDDREFAIADAMVSIGIADQGEWTNENAWVLSWTGTGLVWSEDISVSLSLVTPPVGGL